MLTIISKDCTIIEIIALLAVNLYLKVKRGLNGKMAVGNPLVFFSHFCKKEPYFRDGKPDNKG
jgi:hypothetical protein